MNQITEGVVTILVAVIGLATIAVLVGRNAQTSKVISSAGSAFSGILGVAVSPVAGGSSFSTFG